MRLAEGSLSTSRWSSPAARHPHLLSRYPLHGGAHRRYGTGAQCLLLVIPTVTFFLVLPPLSHPLDFAVSQRQCPHGIAIINTQ